MGEQGRQGSRPDGVRGLRGTHAAQSRRRVTCSGEGTCGAGPSWSGCSCSLLCWNLDSSSQQVRLPPFLSGSAMAPHLSSEHPTAHPMVLPKHPGRDTCPISTSLQSLQWCWPPTQPRQTPGGSGTSPGVSLGSQAYLLPPSQIPFPGDLGF